MAIDFKKLKKNRGTLSEKLASEVDALTKKTYDEDLRFWTPDVDKAKNGSAIFRFLPTADEDGEGTPFARIYAHQFQGPGGWYWENCLTTLNQKDPCCEDNNKLWESGVEANKEIVSKSRKRKTSYISNIFIVKDPNRPENVGKVFLYKYGKTIFDMITELSAPDDEDEPRINPFDLWEGADFKMVIKEKAGYRNYDASKFLSPSIVGGFTDEEIQVNILDKIHKVSEFIDAKQFKSYDTLKERLVKVLGGSTAKKNKDADDDFDDAPVKQPKSTKTKKENDAPWTEPAATDDDSDVADFFKKLDLDE